MAKFIVNIEREEEPNGCLQLIKAIISLFVIGVVLAAVFGK